MNDDFVFFTFVQAKKKPLTVKSLLDLDISIKPHIKVLKVEDPPTRVAGVKVDSVDALVSKLKEAGVIN